MVSFASIIRPLIPVIPCLALLSCATEPSGTTENEDPAAIGPKLIGRIASVPTEGGFVLIQKFGATKLPNGTVLTSRGGDDRNANLLVTGESLGQFTAADIRSGHVRTGDGVYSHHVPKPADPADQAELTTEATESEQNTESENVQKNN